MSGGVRTSVGQPIERVDAIDKVSGTARFVGDYIFPGCLHAKLATSSYAHAKIKSIDTDAAWQVPGVKAIITGDIFPYHIGPILADRPPLAFEKVRYYGEPIAIVVAEQEYQAKQAALKIKVEYEPLPVVNSVQQAFQNNSPLVHEQAGQYKKIISNVYPVSGTNIGSHIKIRKGDFISVWENCPVKVSATYSFNLSDHAALETRCALVEINPAGQVIVHSTSQSPFTIKKVLNQFFNIAVGDITVHIPVVGGAFGGKGTVQLEPLAYLASKAVGGRLVRLQYEREEDLITAPGHIGLEATIKLGADEHGKLMAGQYTYLIDSGAYTDQAAGITRAAALDCTGPYHVPNVWCDSYCMYTNHPYATSFRGYAHPELTFAVERTMDRLAKQLNIDPIELRLINTIKPGHTSPTQAVLTASNIGDGEQCIQRVKQLINWDEGQRKETKQHKIIAKGISLFWKTSTTATNAQSGALIKFEADGSVNVNCAAIELGQGTKTILTQLVAEKLGINPNKIKINMDINTQYAPHQWRTVASSTTFLAGRAVIAAADDAIKQLKKTASIVLQCSPEDLAVGGGRVYLKPNPEYGVPLEDIALGYKFPNGHAIEGQILGTGKYIQRHLTPMDQETGFGKPGPWWSIGAQAVEIEWDPQDYTYKIIKAATVLDGGTIINPATATQQMRGGMYLGLSFASRETFIFDEQGIVRNPQLRNYPIMRFGEQPNYLVDFIQTPTIDGPYGARGIGEYGVIGMPAALANALSTAAQVDLNQLPLIPELIWKTKKETSE